MGCFRFRYAPIPDFDIKALNDYAHSKGVKLMMHHETSSSVINYERHLNEAFNLMDKYGYDAVSMLRAILSHVVTIISQQAMNNHYLYVGRRSSQASHYAMRTKQPAPRDFAAHILTCRNESASRYGI